MTEHHIFTAFVSEEKVEPVMKDLQEIGARAVSITNGPVDFSEYNGPRRGYGVYGECLETHVQPVKKRLRGANAYLVDIRESRRL